jgi:hypothetical protein
MLHVPCIDAVLPGDVLCEAPPRDSVEACARELGRIEVRRHVRTIVRVSFPGRFPRAARPGHVARGAGTRASAESFRSFGDPSGSLSNLRLEIPLDLVALRAA